ncbi:MAG: GNAT family N-acetyltransferase [Pseudomonadota bacterium]
MAASNAEFRIADLSDAQIRNLLATHTERALANARCREGHALDLKALQAADIEVWSVWVKGVPVAVGALRRIDPTHGELKSMFVADRVRGCGLGQALLDHLIHTAQQRGMIRLSLETGGSSYFNAARRLYAGNGFTICDAFADLQPHKDSVFMTRKI